MKDTTVKKVTSAHAPVGEGGQRYLVSGKRVAMRQWVEEPGAASQTTERDFETVGFVVSGRAELEVAGQKVILEPGDSWLVPSDVEHSYRILESFVAVEATSPPARVHDRDR